VTDQRTDGRRQSALRGEHEMDEPGPLGPVRQQAHKAPIVQFLLAEVVVVTKSALDAADPGLYRQREFITLVGGAAAAWRHAVGARRASDIGHRVLRLVRHALAIAGASA